MPKKAQKPILVIVITGPSGVGQTTIATALLKRRKKLGLIRGTTSRPKQKRHGGDRGHIFVSTKKFLALKKQGSFLETDRSSGIYYGTSWAEIKRVVKNHQVPLLTLTFRGHAQLKKNPSLRVCSIFIAPENLQILKQRILHRQKDMSTVELNKRLRVARSVIKHKKDYDFVIINSEGKLKDAVRQALRSVDSCLRLG